jgi:hypothetical protein
VKVWGTAVHRGQLGMLQRTKVCGGGVQGNGYIGEIHASR